MVQEGLMLGTIARETWQEELDRQAYAREQAELRQRSTAAEAKAIYNNLLTQWPPELGELHLQGSAILNANWEVALRVLLDSANDWSYEVTRQSTHGRQTLSTTESAVRAFVLEVMTQAAQKF